MLHVGIFVIYSVKGYSKTTSVVVFPRSLTVFNTKYAILHIPLILVLNNGTYKFTLPRLVMFFSYVDLGFVTVV